MITVGTCLGRAAWRGRWRSSPPHQIDADLDQFVAAGVGADEHDHVVVLSYVVDRKPQSVQHVLVARRRGGGPTPR